MNDSGRDFDAVIIGGGPAGLSAAIYTARERLRTVVLEKAVFGGMAAITETIDNYPGFSKGVSGRQLADELVAQAQRFGTVCENFVEATGIQAQKSGGYIVQTNEGEYRAKTVLVTTGSTYRQMGVPGEADLIGRGVHFCATCDAPLYKDREVIVVGGGNSAMQESLFIARFASSVTMLVRGDVLTGSEILQEEIQQTPHVTIRYGVSVQSLSKPDLHGKILLSTSANGKTEELAADGVFVFIGLLPNAHGFESLGVDERGFIKTNQQFSTHLPGVYVAGDIRSGSTWQIACSVGEGVAAALTMRSFVDDQYPDWHK